MIAAHVLAGELGRSKNSPLDALRRYESLLHPFMLGKQKAAENWGHLRQKRDGDFFRNQITKAFAISFVPSLLTGSSLLDRIDLPD
jgi:hypothetical protein